MAGRFKTQSPRWGKTIDERWAERQQSDRDKRAEVAKEYMADCATREWEGGSDNEFD